MIENILIKYYFYYTFIILFLINSINKNQKNSHDLVN